MATIKPVSLVDIVLACRARLVAVVGFPEERILLYSPDDVILPPPQADQLLHFWPDVSNPVLYEEAGRIDTRLGVRLTVQASTFFGVDAPGDLTAWLTDAQSGHLALIERVFDALVGFWPEDATGTQITDRPLHPATVAKPQPDRKEPGWGTTRMAFVATRIVPLDQTYRPEGQSVLSYAGVTIDRAWPEVAAWVERTLTLRDVCEFERQNWPGKRLTWLTFPGTMPDRPIQLDTLFWPRGASRFATFHAIVTGSQATLIRAVCFGGSYGAQPLVATWEDSAAGGVTVDGIAPAMWCLPLRPLQPNAGAPDGLWLLSLVDERYFWWLAGGPIPVSEGSTTWADLYDRIGALLGISISYDAIAAAYLTPNGQLATQYEYLPLLLDAVAYNVGQRITRSLDGSVYASDPLTAVADIDANLTLPSARSRRAGGAFWLNCVSANDLSAALPARVTLTFPQLPTLSNRKPADAPVTVNITEILAPELVCARGVGEKVFHDARCYDGFNAGELRDLAIRFATDWCRFAAAQVELCFDGIVAWDPDAISDSVEWSYRADDLCTRVRTRPWSDLTQELLHGTSCYPLTSGGGDTGQCPTVTLPPTTMLQCLYGVLYEYGRNITLRTIGGCVVSTIGEWYFERTAGCCACLDAGCCQCTVYCVTVAGLSGGCDGNGTYRLSRGALTSCNWSGALANGSTATMSMSAGKGSSVTLTFSTFGGCTAVYQGVVSDCNNFSVSKVASTGAGWPGTLAVSCCGTQGSGSGSSSYVGCLPGTCQYCTDPPYLWTVGNPGFGGLCAVFNRDWRLSPTGDPCSWSQSVLVNGVLCKLTLFVSANNQILFFNYGNAAGAPIASAYYETGFGPSQGECCLPVTFSLPSGGNCQCGGVQGSGCGNCLDRKSPKSWAVVIGAGAFDECLIDLNDRIIVTDTAPGGCQWVYNDLQIYLSVSVIGGFTRVVLGVWDFAGVALQGQATYYHEWAGNFEDCCPDSGTIVVSYTLASCTVNPQPSTHPATLELVAIGCGDSKPACPAKIVATPFCCLNHPPPVCCNCDVYCVLVKLPCLEFPTYLELFYSTGLGGVCQWRGESDGVIGTLVMDDAVGSRANLVIYYSDDIGVRCSASYDADLLNACGLVADCFLFPVCLTESGEEGWPKALAVECCGHSGTSGRGTVIDTLCCAAMPVQLVAHLLNPFGCTCFSLDGQAITLTYNKVNQSWEGQDVVCMHTMKLRMYCNAGVWWIQISWLDGCSADIDLAMTLLSCPPAFNAVVTSPLPQDCGGGGDLTCAFGINIVQPS